MKAVFGLHPRLFSSVFGLIFLAELPDKTAFATMLLATRKHPVALFVGAAGAFAVQSLVAVSFGTTLSLLPHAPVRLAAGALFLVFAVLMWRRGAEEDEPELPAAKRASFLRAAWTAFAVIFAAEWGDLTQLATATLAAKHRAPLTIFLAATLALWAVTALTIVVGRRARRHLDPAVLHRVAALAFALVGVAMLAS
ncbi:MAG: TMEM165/GDT1 family protein [Elusimicrobia bacterium]|nr:TMEM165/GDT1 family protein [Elusimicrobiota bacterium]